MAHHGIIYMIRNDMHPPGVFKVGMTTRNITERIADLNAETSNIGNFKPLAYFPVNNVEAAEAECHKKLKPYTFKKEFFQGKPGQLLSIIQEITGRYKPVAHIDPEFESANNYNRGNIVVSSLGLVVRRLLKFLGKSLKRATLSEITVSVLVIFIATWLFL